MRIITLNVNGIRSAASKGFFAWLASQNADIVCLQETKAQAAVLTDPQFRPEGYFCYYQDAIKKGYSGVAIYTRQKPLEIHTALGWSIADEEGRYLQLDFDNFSVISLYLPSGSSGEERQAVKFDFLNRYMPYLCKLREHSREYIICGDWNIAHKAIDLKNWRANQKHSGFLPEERAWLDELLGPVGFVDAFRLMNQEQEQYTWWSNRGRSWEKNVGWRIDYQIITPKLSSQVRQVSIYKETRFSDHAPLIIDYDDL